MKRTIYEDSFEELIERTISILKEVKRMTTHMDTEDFLPEQIEKTIQETMKIGILFEENLNFQDLKRDLRGMY